MKPRHKWKLRPCSKYWILDLWDADRRRFVARITTHYCNATFYSPRFGPSGCRSYAWLIDAGGYFRLRFYLVDSAHLVPLAYALEGMVGLNHVRRSAVRHVRDLAMKKNSNASR